MLTTVDGILLIQYKLCLLIWLSPGCWTTVASFYLERKKVNYNSCWSKNIPLMVRSLWDLLRQLMSLPELVSEWNCRECRNILFKSLVLIVRKGISAICYFLLWLCKVSVKFKKKIKKYHISLHAPSPLPVQPFISAQPFYWVNRKMYFQVVARSEASIDLNS